MALSKTAEVVTVPSESGGLKRSKGESTLASSSGVQMHASNSAGMQDLRLGTSKQPSVLDLELPQLSLASVQEGAGQSTTHDFLSLYKSAASARTTEPAALQGFVSSIATQDFLQPWEQCAKSVSECTIPCGLIASTSFKNQVRHDGEAETSYGRNNGTMELSSILSVCTNGGWKDEGGSECKTNTSRSKHSATEQRRRSKINDRFQMLRQLVPYSDQKRDKASFLLEVSEYIQFLQEKVQKYEATELACQHERAPKMSWDISQRNSGMQHYAGNKPVVVDPLDEKMRFPVMPTVPSDLKRTSDIVMSTSTAAAAAGEQEGATSIVNGHLAALGSCARMEKVEIREPTPVALSAPSSFLRGCSLAQSVSQSHTSWDDEQVVTPCPHGMVDAASHVPCGNDPSHVTVEAEQCGGFIHDSIVLRPEFQQEPMVVQGGVITVSSVYSQKLLNTLTKTLQSSGLDFSQANISVQINFGNSAVATTSPPKAGNQILEGHEKQPALQECERYTKKLKVEM